MLQHTRSRFELFSRLPPLFQNEPPVEVRSIFSFVRDQLGHHLEKESCEVEVRCGRVIGSPRHNYETPVVLSQPPAPKFMPGSSGKRKPNEWTFQSHLSLTTFQRIKHHVESRLVIEAALKRGKGRSAAIKAMYSESVDFCFRQGTRIRYSLPSNDIRSVLNKSRDRNNKIALLLPSAACDLTFDFHEETYEQVQHWDLKAAREEFDGLDLVRHKRRKSIFVGNLWRIDMTASTAFMGADASSNDVTDYAKRVGHPLRNIPGRTFEIELEMSTQHARREYLLMKEGKPNRYDLLVASFIRNARYLAECVDQSKEYGTVGNDEPSLDLPCWTSGRRFPLMRPDVAAHNRRVKEISWPSVAVDFDNVPLSTKSFLYSRRKVVVAIEPTPEQEDLRRNHQNIAENVTAKGLRPTENPKLFSRPLARHKKKEGGDRALQIDLS